ncbi:uncharacterized protein LOC132555858 [Ylistrum balloti]|uniref:uncharacterized protein LOC132555858 n=1 Tax=Ylistrum balloti TaxID=509963 RepID=UPI002905B07F|nr:uncharacterized protein LOC132555858 [Ylistrum balloti]
MQFEEDTRSGKCTCLSAQGVNKLLLIVAVCLAATTIIVIAVLIWKEFSEDKRITSATLKKSYPGYFRTEEEQLEFERKSSIYHIVKENVTSPWSCGVNCFLKNKTVSTSPRTRRSALDTTFNGCCQSNTFFISPNFKDNLFGATRELVSLDEARQFFQTGSCQFAIGCTGCTCMMSKEIDTAVVYKTGETADTAESIDDTEIDTFYFEKCCKCVNIGQ